LSLAPARTLGATIAGLSFTQEDAWVSMTMFVIGVAAIALTIIPREAPSASAVLLTLGLLLTAPTIIGEQSSRLGIACLIGGSALAFTRSPGPHPPRAPRGALLIPAGMLAYWSLIYVISSPSVAPAMIAYFAAIAASVAICARRPRITLQSLHFFSMAIATSGFLGLAGVSISYVTNATTSAASPNTRGFRELFFYEFLRPV